jgi:hypothetical protein
MVLVASINNKKKRKEITKKEREEEKEWNVFKPQTMISDCVRTMA